MPAALPYAFEKLSGAVESLATSPASIQQRIATALLGIHTLSTNDFPEGEMRDAWERLQRQKNAALEAEPRSDGLEDACSRLSDLEAREAARSIFALYLLLIGSGHGFYRDLESA